jgi:hypothetical protein
MPTGLLTIVPLAVPLEVTSLTTVLVKVYRAELKVAVQLMLPVIVTLPAAVQFPDQPANVEPDVGAAVNVTAVPLLSVVEQVLPQLIPPALLVTVPVPVPTRVTVSVCAVMRLNTAVQLMLAFIVTLPSLQSALPDQLEKLEPLAGAAVNFTTVPPVYTSAQSLPQMMPMGELVTVPLPERVKVSVKLAATVVPQISFVYAELPAVLNALTR